MRHLETKAVWCGERLLALTLALLLLFAAFPALPQPADAAEGGDTEITQCTDLNEMFTITNMQGTPTVVDKNTISVTATNTIQSGGVKSKKKVSLRTDWEIKMLLSIPHLAESEVNIAHINIFSDSGNVLQFMMLNHKNSKTDGWHGDPNWGSCTGVLYGATDQHDNFGPAGAITGYQTVLNDSDYGPDREASLEYHWDVQSQEGTFTFTFNGYKTVFVNDKIEDESTYISLEAYINPSGGSLDTKVVKMDFTSFRYLFYDPDMVVCFLDPDDNTRVLDYALPGDTVTVEAVTSNSGSNYSFPAILKNSDKNAHVGITPCTGDAQKIYINGTLMATDSTHDITQDGGIVFSLPTGDDTTTIRYNATVTGQAGSTATVYQRLQDDFFKNNYYHQATLTIGKPMIPSTEDPDRYDYTLTGPHGQNGWYTGTVVVALAPTSTYDELYFDSATAPVPDGKKQFAEETDGTETEFYGVQSTDGKKSGTTAKSLKIDKTAPTLSVGEGGTLALEDNLSGIWKLQRYDVDSKKWVDAQTFALTDGGGDLSQNITLGQNGNYRVQDAAGNYSQPLTVTVNDAPDVTPSDPTKPLPQPGQSIDETGLAHAVVCDSMQECLNKEDPLYGGHFTLEDAQKLFEERYGFTSHVVRDDGLTYVYTISQDGVDVTAQGVDSTSPGSFTVTCVATDADGNTTTVQLTDTLIDRGQPPVIDWGEDPDPPVGPPFDELRPTPKPVVKEDPDTGKHNAHVYDSITEPVKDPAAYGGKLTAAVAEQILSGRYQLHTAQGDGVLEYGPVKVTVDGKDVGTKGLDTSRPGSCLITQTVTDSQGNTTTIYLTYNFIGRDEPPALDYDPGSDTVRPGDKLPAPEVITDWQTGTQYATIRDRLVQEISDPPLYGGSLDLDGVRALLGGRYRITLAQADGKLREVRLTIDGGAGSVETIDTTRAGQYLITYTVEDSAGNRTTLFLEYILTPSGAGRLYPEGENGPPSAGENPYTGADGTGIDGSCSVHWLELLGVLLTALYCLWARKRRAADRGPGWGDIVMLCLLGAAAVSLWFTRRCALDAPLLWCWAAVLAAGLGQLMAPGKEERTD